MLLRKYFRTKLVLISDGSATEELVDKPVQQGTVRIYTHITIENHDNAMTEARVGFLNGSIFESVQEQDTPSAGTQYWIVDDIYVYEEERLKVQIKGATSGDRIHAIMQGYTLYQQNTYAKILERD